MKKIKKKIKKKKKKKMNKSISMNEINTSSKTTLKDSDAINSSQFIESNNQTFLNRDESYKFHAWYDLSSLKYKNSKESIVTIGKPLSNNRCLYSFLRPGYFGYKLRQWAVLLFTIYNCIFIPAAFYDTLSDSSQQVLFGLNIFVDLIFILDLVLNFKTAYINRWSQLIWDKNLIYERYLNGLFKLDLIAAIPFDYLLYPIFQWNIRSEAFQIARLNRIFRFHRLYTDPLLESKKPLFRLLRLSFMLLLLCHWVGSIFWYIGTKETGNDIFDSPWPTFIGIDTADFWTQYVNSLYFAIVTIITVGYGDIHPNTNAEKFASIVAIMVGALFYAVIFGNVAIVVKNMSSKVNSHKLDLDNLESFMEHYKDHIPTNLKAKLRKKLVESWEVHKGISADEVLSKLPQSARADVMVNMRAKLLNGFEAFSTLSIKDFPLVRDLILGTISKVYLANELVYRMNSLPKSMGFLAEGALISYRADASKVIDSYKTGDSFCGIEMVLGKKRTVNIQTVKASDIVFLSAEHYHTVLAAHHPHFASKFSRISEHLWQQLNERFKTEKQLVADQHWNFLGQCALEIGKKIRKERINKATTLFWQKHPETEKLLQIQQINYKEEIKSLKQQIINLKEKLRRRKKKKKKKNFDDEITTSLIRLHDDDQPQNDNDKRN